MLEAGTCTRTYTRPCTRTYTRACIRRRLLKMEKLVRKLRKISTPSYGVVLLKQLVEKFGWQKRQKVEIILSGRKHKNK